MKDKLEQEVLSVLHQAFIEWGKGDKGRADHYMAKKIAEWYRKKEEPEEKHKKWAEAQMITKFYKD